MACDARHTVKPARTTAASGGVDAKGAADRLRRDDRVDVLGSESVVLGVDQRGDVVRDLRPGRREPGVALEAARSDPALAGGPRAHEPRVLRAMGRAYVDTVAEPDRPDRHVAPERAVGSAECDVELLGALERLELLGGPAAHRVTSSVYRLRR